MSTTKTPRPVAAEEIYDLLADRTDASGCFHCSSCRYSRGIWRLCRRGLNDRLARDLLRANDPELIITLLSLSDGEIQQLNRLRG